MNMKNALLWTAKTMKVDIVVKTEKAQLLVAAAILILAMGIAWSFINGTSWIKYNKKPKSNSIETIELKK